MVFPLAETSGTSSASVISSSTLSSTFWKHRGHQWQQWNRKTLFVTLCKPTTRLPSTHRSLPCPRRRWQTCVPLFVTSCCIQAIPVFWTSVALHKLDVWGFTFPFSTLFLFYLDCTFLHVCWGPAHVNVTLHWTNLKHFATSARLVIRNRLKSGASFLW